ncbi:hypothetical protein Y1Q_0002856 [Alligator mississippiensis]|uniref:DDE Tnp4 domain-containing protein n=1 Tax=Alligator mississippiensis TaxID=8496 RepID=A0A151NZD5_ALLMI|nr:hypothetical protein Y1Q_0002856 [Alligator mississippiensis]
MPMRGSMRPLLGLPLPLWASSLAISEPTVAAPNWLQHLVQKTWDDEQWVNAFWLTWATFWDLVQQLWPHLEFQDTSICLALPTNIRLAVLLLKLATPTSLQYVGHLFGVRKATIREAVLDLYKTDYEASLVIYRTLWTSEIEKFQY